MAANNEQALELPLTDDPSIEAEDDLAKITGEQVSRAVVTGTDWTTETILSQIDKGNIALNPKFQRRDAWTPIRKSAFIESLMLGLPVPQIVLAESQERKGAYIVLDGKQRLLSIRQFAALDGDEKFQQLTLRSLAVRQELNGRTLADLRKEPKFAADVSSFENQTIRTVVIRNWQPNEDFLYLVFLRLNTNSVGLSPQELRLALHPGPFMDYADSTSFDSAAIKRLLKLSRPDFRMRDVELLVRYVAFLNFVSEYRGSLKAFLDDACRRLNADWARMSNVVPEQMRQLDAAHDLCANIFGPENVCRKWSGNAYQPRFNRAVFDVVMFYFSDPEIRGAAAKRTAQVEQAYKNLFQDADFVASVERTTKSLEATRTRFVKWSEALGQAIDLKLDVPAFRG